MSEEEENVTIGTYIYRKRRSTFGQLDPTDVPECEFRRSVLRQSEVAKRASQMPNVPAAMAAAAASIGEDGGDDPVLKDGTGLVEDSGVFNKQPSTLHKVFTCLTKGGTKFDAFLLAAAQEVGQSIMVLPYVFSLVGMSSGIILQFLFATTALYTNYLLVNLHTEFRKRLALDDTDPRGKDSNYVVSYHDIMGGLIGPTLKWFSLAVCFLSLFGLTTVQLIATGSNMYIFDPVLDKRTWVLISGGIFSLLALVPNFRHYRFLVVMANIATTYTSWFMVIEAASTDTDGMDIVHDAPTNYDDWFRGMVTILFMFGGHASNIEVADVMDDHSEYDQAYMASFFYVFTLTLPNAITAYAKFGQLARLEQNAFGLYEPSPARDFGIIMMNINNLVAFGLFCGPLFHVLENFLHVHEKPFYIRVLVSRLPVVALIILFAVAFPFYAAINSVLGAFTTSFTTYILPMVAFNITFRTQTDISDMAKPLPSWITTESRYKILWYVNWIVAGTLFVTGVGFGGYASMSNFISQINNFEYFAACYDCYLLED